MIENALTETKKMKAKMICIFMLIAIMVSIYFGFKNNYTNIKIIIDTSLSIYGLHLFGAFLLKEKIHLFHTVVNVDDRIELRLFCAVLGLIIFLYFTIGLIL